MKKSITSEDAGLPTSRLGRACYVVAGTLALVGGVAALNILIVTLAITAGVKP